MVTCSLPTASLSSFSVVPYLVHSSLHCLCLTGGSDVGGWAGLRSQDHQGGLACLPASSFPSCPSHSLLDPPCVPQTLRVTLCRTEPVSPVQHRGAVSHSPFDVVDEAPRLLPNSLPSFTCTYLFWAPWLGECRELWPLLPPGAQHRGNEPVSGPLETASESINTGLSLTRLFSLASWTASALKVEVVGTLLNGSLS